MSMNLSCAGYVPSSVPYSGMDEDSGRQAPDVAAAAEEPFDWHYGLDAKYLRCVLASMLRIDLRFDMTKAAHSPTTVRFCLDTPRQRPNYLLQTAAGPVYHMGAHYCPVVGGRDLDALALSAHALTIADMKHLIRLRQEQDRLRSTRVGRVGRRLSPS